MDVGSVRIGVARSDQLGHMAIPLETVKRDLAAAPTSPASFTWRRNGKPSRSSSAFPRHLAGNEGASAKAAKQFARRLQRRSPQIRVCLVDERLSSNQAHGRLTEVGPDSRAQRSIVDQVAAQIILEQALEMERLSGSPPGEDLRADAKAVTEKTELDERTTGE